MGAHDLLRVLAVRGKNEDDAELVQDIQERQVNHEMSGLCQPYNASRRLAVEQGRTRDPAPACMPGVRVAFYDL